MSRTLISVSTHPAKNNISSYIQTFEQAGVDMFHCDVMDGLFVKDTAFSLDLLNQLKSNTTLALDVHLMVKKPEGIVKKYCVSGANIVTVHKECFKTNKQLVKCLKLIKQFKVMAGVSISPNTSVDSIKEILEIVDLVLVMSVEPGKSGQSFMPESLKKIDELYQIRALNNFNFLIEVDGGINAENAELIVRAGADILVSGSYLYNSKNHTKAVETLRINK